MDVGNAIEAKFKKYEGAGAAVNAVIGSKTSTNRILSKLKARRVNSLTVETMRAKAIPATASE